MTTTSRKKYLGQSTVPLMRTENPAKIRDRFIFVTHAGYSLRYLQPETLGASQ